MSTFSHPALNLKVDKPLIYTALSKHTFYLRMFISAFVLKKGGVPLNPFMQFDYYLADLVERDIVREANNNLVKRADEVWVFGPVSNGVLAEVKIAHERGTPVKYFAVDEENSITEVSIELVEMEQAISKMRHEL